MAQKITVNGAVVYSNKQVRNITEDGRIHFVDGSWCDTRSGTIHNVGGGSIQLAQKSIGILPTCFGASAFALMAAVMLSSVIKSHKVTMITWGACITWAVAVVVTGICVALERNIRRDTEELRQRLDSLF